MLRRCVVLICCFGALPLGASGSPHSTPAAADTIEAMAVGQWQVQYEDWGCALHRELSVGGKPGYFSLSIEPTNPLASVQLAVRGAGDPSEGNATVILDGQRVPKVLPYSAFVENGNRVRTFDLNIIQQSLDSLRGGIRLSTERDGDIEVKLDNFQSAWMALNKCLVDLYRDLKINKSDLTQIAKAPKGGTFWYVDNPRVPYVEIAIFYWITPEGRAEDCRLLKPSGYQNFDASVCKQIERKARFTPGRNSAGERIRVPHYEHDHLRQMVIHAPG